MMIPIITSVSCARAAPPELINAAEALSCSWFMLRQLLFPTVVGALSAGSCSGLVGHWGDHRHLLCPETGLRHQLVQDHRIRGWIRCDLDRGHLRRVSGPYSSLASRRRLLPLHWNAGCQRHRQPHRSKTGRASDDRFLIASRSLNGLRSSHNVHGRRSQPACRPGSPLRRSFLQCLSLSSSCTPKSPGPFCSWRSTSHSNSWRQELLRSQRRADRERPIRYHRPFRRRDALQFHHSASVLGSLIVRGLEASGVKMASVRHSLPKQCVHQPQYTLEYGGLGHAVIGTLMIVLIAA